MSEMALVKNIGAYVLGEPALAITNVNAGAAGDGGEVDGFDFDRQQYANEQEPPMSAALMINVALTGGTTVPESWDIDVQLQDGATTAAYADVTLKDGSTSFTETMTIDTDDAAFKANRIVTVDLNLMKLRRFVRVQVTPTFTGTTTTTKDIDFSAIYVTGGSNIIPAAAS